MSKQLFHRGKNGSPMPCSAEPGKCPLGGHGDKNFTQNYCDKINEALYDININQLKEKADIDSANTDVYRTALYERENKDKEKIKLKINDLKFEDYKKPDSGLSLNTNNNELYNGGFCMSPYPDRSEGVSKDMSDKEFQDYLTDYTKRNNDLLSQPNHCLGLWRDDQGTLWIDVSIVTNDASDCRSIGEGKDQIAYFDLQQGKSITINKDATSGQRKSQKIDDLNTLKDFITKEEENNIKEYIKEDFKQTLQNGNYYDKYPETFNDLEYELIDDNADMIFEREWNLFNENNGYEDEDLISEEKYFDYAEDILNKKDIYIG